MDLSKLPRLSETDKHSPPPQPEAQQQFSEWAKEDYYPPLATELRLLAEAGFAEPDCFWRTAPFTVFGGVRS